MKWWKAPVGLAAAGILAASTAAVPTEQRALRTHVSVLADDAMAGRKAGTAAYERAAGYVVEQFNAAGLMSAPGSDWLQRVPLVALAHAEPGQATFTRRGRTVALGPDDIALSLPAQQEDEHVSGTLVAAGHCIVDRAAGVDDFAGLDLRGRIAACKAGAPASLSPSARTIHGEPAEQARAARARGAIGIVLIQSAGQAETTSFSRIARAWRAPRLVIDDLADEGRVLGLLSAGAAARVLAGEGQASLTLDSSAWRERLSSSNVVGWLPGADPRRRREAVVVTAHLDHLGDQVPPMMGSADRIANGALDNAMGVAVMIEVARRLAQAPRRPARSILFVAFTAEEQGLLGSRWFVRHMPVAGGRLVANVNLDMPIITYPLADVLLRGTGWDDALFLRAAERQLGLPIMVENDTAPPSDNLSFTRVGVRTYVPLPGVGGDGAAAVRRFLAEHYHRPSDDLSLPIDWTAANRYVTFVHLLTSEIAEGAT
ncbi:MAG: M20/M25/M40 family metallo-hydrolase [Pseudomonadota bacterium]|nr:M20/M25/M40 family metallo-hydrolase [Pseudomonadota bacterium]